MSTLAAFAQCTAWDQLLYYKYVSLHDAARDRFGNLYIVGHFSAQDFTIGSYTFPVPPGGHGAFIAKFNKTYSLEWAVSPETGDIAIASEIEIDENDNIVVAGSYFNSISFGCIDLHGGGRYDVFVVNYLRDGTPAWAITSGGADDANPSGLTISANGNIILTSNFVERSSVTPGLTAPDISIGGVPVKTGSTNQIAAGYDSFVASIRPNGIVEWTQGIGGDGNAYDYTLDVTTDTGNNVIVTGYFNSPEISFDGKIVHSHAISENYFLAKINPAGETLWVRETEGNINQSGWGVATDNNNNIFVAGRFYGDAKFGGFNLPGAGEADVFVVKVDPDGTTMNARAIGNDDFDAGTEVAVDSQGKVIVSAYYYSDYLEIGSFSSIKPEFFADSFVATLSNDLNTVDCAKFITGDAESIVWNMEVDALDNVLVMTDLMLASSTTYFDSKTITGDDYWTAIAILGENAATDTDDGEELSPVFSLGKDTTLCTGQTLALSVREICGALYNWSTGSTGTSALATQAGVYWVDVTWQGKTVRDEIVVSYMQPITVSLGADQTICAGNTINLVLPLYTGATYQWSNGGTSNVKSITTPGTYWVQVSTRCQTARDTVAVNLIAPPAVDLGADISACSGEAVTLHYAAKDGETFLWSDGSGEPELSITQSGTYQISVSNGCFESGDEIQVVIRESGEIEIPNIVTHNTDGKNDHFLLPDNLTDCSLRVYDRWGKQVFNSPKYENNWPQQDISAGIYFYTLRSECLTEAKGTITVMK